VIILEDENKIMNNDSHSEESSEVKEQREEELSFEKKQEPELKQEPEQKPDLEEKPELEEEPEPAQKANVWKTVSFFIGILFIASVFTNGFSFGDGVTGNTISITPDEAADKAASFINTNLLQPGMEATFDSVEEDNNLYKINLLIAGTEYVSYVTKDGSLLFPSVIDLNEVVDLDNSGADSGIEEAPVVELESADKASAELYIFSYCPAGSSTLDSFAEAGKILKDVADVKVKFFSHMHGEYEKQQNIIQACIQKVDSDKYWDYAVDFYEDIYNVCGSSRDIECDKEESTKLMEKVGIDAGAVFTCVDEEGDDLYAQDTADAGELALRYSPSVVVNGVYLSNSPRDPEGIKSTICNAFNEAPEECGSVLAEAETTSVGSC
jgi:hypothetical protein